MPRATSRRRKKVSATLPPDIIKSVEQHRRDTGLRSFSAALEDLLWRHQLAERERAYYLSMTETEKAEQDAWARFVAEHAHKTSTVEE
ncbi:MAG: hypothetical protein ACRD4U_00035 [Candidatus Acidiferrales bacterium]